MNPSHLKQAVQICEEGGIIAYPTEAVFGLGCLPHHEHAVRRILNLKQRSVHKGLILVAADIEQFDDYIDFSKIKNLQRIRDSWPGSVTWLISARHQTPYWLTGSHKTLAVRVSSCQTVRALCEELGPLISTSANLKSFEPAKSDQQVRAYFPAGIDYVMPETITNEMAPSEIRDAESGDIVRTG